METIEQKHIHAHQRSQFYDSSTSEGHMQRPKKLLMIQVGTDQKASSERAEVRSCFWKWRPNINYANSISMWSRAHQSKLIFLEVYNLSMYCMIGSEASIYLCISFSADSSVTNCCNTSILFQVYKVDLKRHSNPMDFFFRC